MILTILAQFLADFSRVHGLNRVAVALNSSHAVIVNRYAATPVGIYRRLLAVAAGWKLAFYYYRSAQRDEQNGFPFTAAMEWRMAAELFQFVPMARRCCWGRWERIMHLPRQFATPIFEGGAIVFQDASKSNNMPAVIKDALSA